jgi:hypothetical protein
VDLYYAANANAPAWVHFATLTPAQTGAQMLWDRYVLPSGSLQAVRANLRRQGAPSTCPAGTFNDHDDLVFAVGQ